jgi:putative ABC transport system permease protein
MRTPLAWLNLWHEKIRLAVAIAGVAFADILVFTNLGFLGSVAETASVMYQKINADIYLTSSRSIDLSNSQPFPRQRIYQVAGVNGVKQVMPLYLGYLLWRNPKTHLSRGIFVYGINPHDPVFLLPELQSPENQVALNRWETTLIDRQSRPEFGSIAVGTKTEAGRRQITVGGQFSFGGSFAADGNLIMSDQNYHRYFNPAPLNRIHLGCVLKP